MTERLLVDAGVGPGMRVLDVGCGNGNVSILLAKLVGETGEVAGIDLDGPSLALAREQVRQLHLLNVTFTQGDVCSLSPELGPFDAVVGRRVIMYLPIRSMPFDGWPRHCGPEALWHSRSTTPRW